MNKNYKDIITFWFNELNPKQWWKVDNELDQLIKQRFEKVLNQASLGELFHWRIDSHGRLAEIIILDQFSRNIYRNTAQAFTQDPLALVLAQEAVTIESYRDLSPTETSFLLMPYMHSESKIIHEEAEKLFKLYAPENNYEFELKHKVIVDRFGRYPHRNEILGRESTQEEIEFLKQPGSSF
jgi:uncharacterized protein (DUF924 family)